VLDGGIERVLRVTYSERDVVDRYGQSVLL
jgi:hypothetical protein